MPPRCGMQTTLTPSCLHNITFFSLKKPRSDPYNSGTSPKVCRWRSSEMTTCCSSTGLRSSTSYCVIRPRALSARKTLWPNSIAIEHTAARLIDHTVPQITKVLNLLARLGDCQFADHICATRFASLPERGSSAFDNLIGDADEFAVSPGLLLLALP